MKIARMPETIVALALLSFAYSCTSEDHQLRVFTVSSVSIRSQNLGSLAAETRAQDGLVFVGTTVGATNESPLEGDNLPGPTADTHVTYQFEEGDVTVIDGLGASLPATLRMSAASGPPVVVNAAGSPEPNWFVEDADQWELRAFPSSGMHLYFVRRDGDAFRLVLSSPVTDGIAQPRGTVESTPVSVSTLRVE